MTHRTIRFKDKANKAIVRRAEANTNAIASVAMPKNSELVHISPLRVKMTLAGLNDISELDRMGVVVRKSRSNSKSIHHKRKMVRIIRSGNSLKEQITFANNVYKK